MGKCTKYLVIGSTEAYSGKSSTVIGISRQLQAKGISVAYWKPLGTCTNNDCDVVEADSSILAKNLGLSENQIKPPLLYLDDENINEKLLEHEIQDYSQAIVDYVARSEEDLVLLEGSGNLWDGTLFNLSVGQIAELVNGSVLLVARYHSLLLVDSCLAAKKFLGDRLLGMVITGVPEDKLDKVNNALKPFLEKQKIAVFAILPQNNLLYSVSVRELAKRLQAKVLCREDRLDLIVENFTIGAMNVSSALGYFRQGQNKAVVTGGDRADLQIAALETSTNCLILTGKTPPQDFILSRAESLEVPVLAVDSDTLTTVEIINRSFGRVPIREPYKIKCIQELSQKYFDLERLLKQLNL